MANSYGDNPHAAGMSQSTLVESLACTALSLLLGIKDDPLCTLSADVAVLHACRYSPINTVITLDQYNIITGVGFGGGSICFFLGASLLLARQARLSLSLTNPYTYT